MNKNLKKIVAIALAFSAFSAIAPAANNNLLTTKAYASSDDENDSALSSLKLETSGGSSIQLYDDDSYKSADKVDKEDISDNGKYYAKTSSDKISISISGVKSKYVRVFKGTSNSTKGKKVSSDISLSSGTNTIVVKVYSEDPGSSVRNDEDSLYSYTLKVKYTGSSSSNDDDDDNSQDSIYLSSISLSEGDINFSKKTSSYDINVGSSVDEISIKAKPEDSDFKVTIDGSSVDEDDKWKRDVSLNKGKNKIKIEVEDDDDNKRTYTLNINRGTSSSSSSSSNTSDKIFLDSLSVGSTSLSLSENVSAYNLRVKKDVEKIQLKAEPKNDDYTVTIDGTTVNDDDDYKKVVSLEEDVVKTFKVKVKNSSGTEKIYTLNIGRGDIDASKFPTINNTTTNNTTNNTTTNGTTNESTQIQPNVKVNQWVEVSGGQWQYNDATGNPIKNQWFYDKTAAKSFHFDSNGVMQTGWIQDGATWYYLNPVSDGTRGAKMTGWQNVGGTWYYMDSEGKMLSSTTVDGYRLDASGAWIR